MGAPVTTVDPDGAYVGPGTSGGGPSSAQVGAVTETAPATDTASSGLNGRLQRIAQRLTSLIALLPSSLGIKTAANSLSVAPASDAQFVSVGPAAAAAAASGNPLQIGGIMDNTPAAVGAAGTINPLKVDSRGYLWTTIGAGGLSLTTTSGLLTIARGMTTGGLTSARVVTGTTGVIKASAGQLYALLGVRNGNAAVRYLHLYNKATAPTLGTDTPVLTIALNASSVLDSLNFTAIGAAFSAGIAWSYTTDNIAIPATAATSTELMFSGVYQ